MRSSGERTHVYISIVTARPLSPQEGARSRSPQLGTKNVAKQMVKISQGRARHKGILLKSLELVDKNKLLDWHSLQQ